MVGGKGPHDQRKKVNGHPIDYHRSLEVDCTGQLPDGRPFDDVNALRSMLAEDPDRLAQAFLSHLSTYATGAHISFADRATVAEILKKTKAGKHGLRSLIHELVQSKLFRHK